MKHRLAILISGSGTTMQAIANAIKNNEIKNIEIACVVASTPLAGGIERAIKLGINKKDVLVINPQDFIKEDGKVDQKLFGDNLLKDFQKRKVTVFMQCGWLPLTPKNVIQAYEGRCFNQHPGSLPDFGGKGMFGRRVHAATLMFKRATNKDLYIEVICQQVGVEFDSGRVVKSAKIRILPTDTVDDLQQRALKYEHRVQIDALRDFINKDLKFEKIESIVEKEEEKVILKVSKKMAEYLYPNG